MDSEVVGYKLLSRAPAASAVGHLPTKPRDAQLLRGEMDALLRQHMVDNRKILVLIGRMKVNDESETI